MAYRELKFEGTPGEVEAAWLEARKKGIGGSDVASIVGVSKYQSPLETWLVKTGREDSPDMSAKQSVEWGSRLEPVIAEKFAELHPEYSVEEPGCMFVSEERPWAFANVDRVLVGKDGEKGVLEIKTVGLRSSADWDEWVPNYYMTQVVHYLAVTGFSFAWVAVLIGGQEYREYEVKRDEEDVKAISDAVDSFWNDFVMKDIMPQVIGSESESRALSRMFDEPSDVMLCMLDDELPQLEMLEKQKELKKGVEEQIRFYENEVKAAIGDAAGIETETRRVKWVRSTYSKLDTKLLSAEHPEIVSEYTVAAKRDGGLRISKKKGA